MDDTDRRIIGQLRAEGRASWAEIGRRVGLSGPSVQERVKRLEGDGVIDGYRAHVDPTRVGLGTSALIGIFLRDDVETDDVVTAVADIESVEDCWVVAGSEEFTVKVRAADTAELEAVVSALRRIRGVARTRTTVILSTRWESRPAPLRAPTPATD